MANVYDKDKPSPENRPSGSPNRSRYSVWTIVAILIVLALVVWIFAFTYGGTSAEAGELFKVSEIISQVERFTG